MVMRLIDPCQFLSDVWQSSGSGFPLYNNDTAGPFSTDRYMISPRGGFQDLGTNASTLTVGFWWIPNGAITGAIMVFGDVANIQCTLQQVSAGTNLWTLRLINGSAGATLATSASTFNGLVWRYIEIKVTFGNTGSAELRADTLVEFNAVSIDTTTTANNYANRLTLAPNAGTMPRYSAIYVCDSTGATHNTFLGPQRGAISQATSDGAFTAWPANTGTRFGAVDDPVTPDDDTTFVSSSTPGDKVSFNGQAAVVAPTAVLLSGRMKRDDAGPRTARLFLRDAGGTIINAATETLLAGYISYNYLYALDPFTSALWTKANFDAYQRGAELVS